MHPNPRSPRSAPYPPAVARTSPVLGKRARLALKLTAGWSSKRDRSVLVLLAAYSDAGEPSPFAREIADRIGIDVRPDFDQILGRLAGGGLLWTVRRPDERNIYVLRFAGDLVPVEDRERFEAYERRRLEREHARGGDRRPGEAP